MARRHFKFSSLIALLLFLYTVYVCYSIISLPNLSVVSGQDTKVVYVVKESDKTATDTNNAAAPPPPPVLTGQKSWDSASPMLEGGGQAFLKQNVFRKPFRVIFTCDWDYYIHCVSRWFFHIEEGMRDLDGVHTELWGPGWPGWRLNESYEENIERKYKAEGGLSGFDFIFRLYFYYNKTYEALYGWNYGEDTQNTEFRTNPVTKRVSDLVSPPIAIWYHECVAFERLPTPNKTLVFMCPPINANLIFYAYANHMAYYPHLSVGRLMWHQPLVAHMPLMTDNNVERERPIDVLIIGAIGKEWYYLRPKYVRLAKRRKLPGNVVHYKHPPYYLPEADDSTEPRLANEEARKFAQMLRDAKIVLTDSSRRKYAVRKYAEIAAAGALIIGDIPGEREEEFRKYVVELTWNATDNDIIKTVSWWLSHKEERIKRARIGQEIATKKYTTKAAAESMVHAMKSYLAGQRGMVFPHPFSPVNYFLTKKPNCDDEDPQLNRKTH